MKLQNIKKSTWGLIIFSISALIGIIFSGASVWGNIEAFLFNPGLRADENIRTMKCPVLITNSETGTITAAFTNPGDRSAMTTVRTSISDGLFSMIREIDNRIQLEPGETKELEWTVSPEDAAWERLILVRVYSLRSTPLPSRTGTCGILVVNLPFLTGNQVIAIVSIASIAGMVVGLGLWVSTNQPLSRRNRYAAKILGVLAALIIAGIILGFLGWWFIGGLLLVFIVLLVVVTITYFLLASENGGSL
jgi:hypothetical protein